MWWFLLHREVWFMWLERTKPPKPPGGFVWEVGRVCQLLGRMAPKVLETTQATPVSARVWFGRPGRLGRSDPARLDSPNPRKQREVWFGWFSKFW